MTCSWIFTFLTCFLPQPVFLLLSYIILAKNGLYVYLPSQDICPTLIWFGNDAYEIELGLVELRAMDGTHDKRRKVKLAATDHVSDMRTFCPIG